MGVTQTLFSKMDNHERTICLNRLYNQSNANNSTTDTSQPLLIPDKLICIASILVTIIAGFLLNRRTTKKKFSVHEPRISPYIVSLSLCASLLSGISILGPPDMIYTHSNWYLIGLSYPIFTVITVYVIAPRLYGYGSMFDVIEDRYGYFVRIPVMIQYLLVSVYYSAGVLLAPAIALSQLFSYSTEVLTLALGLLIASFSSYGGLKTVIYIDGLQALLMIAMQASVIGLIISHI